MGLDMYLFKDTYIGGNFDFNNVQGEINLSRGRNNKPVNIKLNRLTSIREEVAYWRKANAIHQWFVDNVQDGEDNCGTYFVSADNLRELVYICKVILANPEKAQELLPVASGFFFGSDEYDEWYMNSLKYTIETFESLLEEDPEADYYYHSSW